MKIKVSIILPSYNVVDYIKECLESVVNQTLKEIEIICVDKFSDDGTREIIQRYADSDKRICLLDDDMGSCGYSYNKGINAARGEYIGFVETDDYIHRDMFEILYEKAKKNDLDYVKANHIRFYQVKNSRCFEEEYVLGSKPLDEMYGKVFKPIEYPEFLWPDHCMWNGIYKKDFLSVNHVKLNESPGPSYQDHGFQWQTMTSGNRAMYINEGLYFYRIDNANASMKDSKGMMRDIQECEFVKDFMLSKEEITEQHWWVFYKKVAASLERWCRAFVLSEQKSEGFDEAYECFRRILDEGLGNGYISPIDITYKMYSDVILAVNSKEDYIKRIKAEVKDKLAYRDDLFGKIKDKDIVIFGAGFWGSRLYKAIADNIADTVVGFCDNNLSVQGKVLFDKKIYSVEDAVSKYPMANYVIANSIYYMDCKRQLTGLGIKESNISFYRYSEIEV